MAERTAGDSTIEKANTFAGKTIFITGASSGIGAEITREFVRQGAAEIITVSRPQNAEKALAVVEELRTMGAEARWIGADLSQEKATAQIVAALDEAGVKNIDVLVNNAGAAKETSRFTEEERQRMMRINYLSAVALTNALMERLSSDASIVNISSTAGIYTDEGQPTYSKSKRLLINMAKTWAKSGRLKEGVRINVVAPGFVDGTGMTNDLPPVAKDVVAKETPGEPATTLSVARKVCEIANLSCSANGELFIEDGGLGERTNEALKKAYGLAARFLVEQRRAAREAQNQQPA